MKDFFCNMLDGREPTKIFLQFYKTHLYRCLMHIEGGQENETFVGKLKSSEMFA